MLKTVVSKAAGSTMTEAYLYRTSQGNVRPRTKRAAVFSILLEDPAVQVQDLPRQVEKLGKLANCSTYIIEVRDTP